MKLDDIARKAGVSRATVSRVINNKGYVHAETRARVTQVIEQEQFIPNPAARMLVTQRTNIIGIVAPYLPSTSFDEYRYLSALIQGVTRVTHERDFDVLLWLEQPNDPDGHFYRRLLQNRLMDGLLLGVVKKNDPLLLHLIHQKIPFVAVDRPMEYQDQVSYVTVDNLSGTREAVRHLVALGRRRIATITGRQDHPDGIERLMGYQQILEEAGIPYDPALVHHGDFSAPAGYHGMKALLACQPDAVFASSDATALGALQAIEEAGLRVPDDIAVVGFDDLPLAVTVTPKLTTVHHPVIDKGERAATLLLDMIEGKVTGVHQEFLPAYLVVRESCGVVRTSTSPNTNSRSLSSRPIERA